MGDEKQDISEALLILDGFTGILQELIRFIDNPNIKNFLGWFLLYPLQKALPEWAEHEHHNLIKYDGYTIKVN